MTCKASARALSAAVACCCRRRQATSSRSTAARCPAFSGSSKNATAQNAPGTCTAVSSRMADERFPLFSLLDSLGLPHECCIYLVSLARSAISLALQTMLWRMCQLKYACRNAHRVRQAGPQHSKQAVWCGVRRHARGGQQIARHGALEVARRQRRPSTQHQKRLFHWLIITSGLHIKNMVWQGRVGCITPGYKITQVTCLAALESPVARGALRSLQTRRVHVAHTLGFTLMRSRRMRQAAMQAYGRTQI